MERRKLFSVRQVWVDPRYSEPEDGAWERPLVVDASADDSGIFATAHGEPTVPMDSAVLVERLRKIIIPPSTATHLDGSHAYDLVRPDVEDPSDQQITRRKIFKLLQRLGLVVRPRSTKPF